MVPDFSTGDRTSLGYIAGGGGAGRGYRLIDGEGEGRPPPAKIKITPVQGIWVHGD